eukprot:4539710-Heterocapsa_arctica.AAC.1
MALSRKALLPVSAYPKRSFGAGRAHPRTRGACGHYLRWCHHMAFRRGQGTAGMEAGARFGMRD